MKDEELNLEKIEVSHTLLLKWIRIVGRGMEMTLPHTLSLETTKVNSTTEL